MKLSRRQFNTRLIGAAGLSALGPLRSAFSARNDQLNILCWEGYNSDDVLGPFRAANPGAVVRAESGTSDPDMINKLRAGEVNVWDLININQPWARQQLYPEGLIKPLNKARFTGYFDGMLPEFSAPYPLSFAADGSLLGMPQRFGPFSFVVNTDKISRATAEDEGWNLFLDPAMNGRYGVLTYDNWNIMHMCLTGGPPKSGPVDGKGGVVWIELTSLVNNPDPSTLAEDFLEYVQDPGICKAVAFAEGTYNPIAQMGSSRVLSKFDADELDAIQWESLDEEMSRSLDFQVVPSYNKLNELYNAAKRG